MDRIGFILTSPCSGGERIGSWLSARRSVFVTENTLFGRFCELWPDDRGQMLPAITVDRFVTEWSRSARLGPLRMNRVDFQQRFLDELVALIVDFGLRHSGRRSMIDLVMPFPGTLGAVESGLAGRLPDAPRLKLIRDGRDVLVDQAFRWLLRDTHGTNRYAFFVERRPLKLTRFLDDAFLDRWGRLWNDVARSPMTAPDGSPIERLRYEDWVAAPADALVRLSTHFGLEDLPVASAESVPTTGDSCSSPTAQTSGATEPSTAARQDRMLLRVRKIAAPYRTAVGAWRELFTREDGRRLQDLAGPALIEHGYVDDPKWFLALPEVLDPAKLEAIAKSGDDA